MSLFVCWFDFGWVLLFCVFWFTFGLFAIDFYLVVVCYVVCCGLFGFDVLFVLFGLTFVAWLFCFLVFV